MKKQPRGRKGHFLSNKKKGVSGRPAIPFKQEYCEQLVKHMSEGSSFESFGAIINVSRATIYRWLEEYEEFFEAKELGEVKSLKFWEDLGKAGATGTLRRVSKEVYVKDEQGNVIYEDGRPLTNREYAPARFDSKPWALTMKNRFHWVEPIQLSGRVNTGLKDPSEMSDEELNAELARLDERKSKIK